MIITNYFIDMKSLYQYLIQFRDKKSIRITLINATFIVIKKHFVDNFVLGLENINIQH